MTQNDNHLAGTGENEFGCQLDRSRRLEASRPERT
jgi:hypothetical protein